MKKKILSIISALCFVFAITAMFTACNAPQGEDVVYINQDITLTYALSIVKDGGTIVFQSDMTLDTQVVIDKKVTIDLGGNTINNVNDIWNDSEGFKTWSLLSVQEGGDLTIKNGSLVAKENDCYAIDVRDGAKLTIVDGTYVGNVSAIYVHTGNATISGGNFAILQLSTFNDARYLINCYDENATNDTANVVITGGTYENFDPSQVVGPEQNFVADGYTVGSAEANGATYYSVVAINA